MIHCFVTKIDQIVLSNDFQVPYMVSKLVARGLGISIPTALLMKGLADTLLVPLFIGKVCMYMYFCYHVDFNTLLYYACSHQSLIWYV